MSSLFDHPGFMAYSGGGFEILHADWPAYPNGHGWQGALRALSVFPPAVRFRKLDEIDQCFLFVAVGTGACLEPRLRDPFDSMFFHIAVWKEDLGALLSRNLVTGCSWTSAYEEARAYYERFKGASYETPQGLRRLELPEPREDDFEDGEVVLVISADGVALTTEAEAALHQFVAPLEQLPPSIRERATMLFDLKLYDTAVRECGVTLDSRLREITGSTAFGQRLADEYYAVLVGSNGGRESAALKVLRSELRTLFKFVRNDFAHSLREISPDQCRLLLDRFGRVLSTIDEIEGEKPIA